MSLQLGGRRHPLLLQLLLMKSNRFVKNHHLSESRFMFKHGRFLLLSNILSQRRGYCAYKDPINVYEEYGIDLVTSARH